MSKRAPADRGPFYFSARPVYLVAMHDELELEGLRALPRADCPVPGCRANAKPTGKLVRSSEHWYMEHHCPDCGERYTAWFPELDELIARLDAAPETEHEAIAASWVAGNRSPRFIRD